MVPTQPSHSVMKNVSRTQVAKIWRHTASRNNTKVQRVPVAVSFIGVIVARDNNG